MPLAFFLFSSVISCALMGLEAGCKLTLNRAGEDFLEVLKWVKSKKSRNISAKGNASGSAR